MHQSQILLDEYAPPGLVRYHCDETDSIDIYDSSLTLDGLRIIYDKNRK
jgi:type III pantothenate kinase